jgi:serine/threonine-protein kinase RIM15
VALLCGADLFWLEFDCILMDLHMPVRECILCLDWWMEWPLIDCVTVDGEGAARYIRSTNSKNTNTPIIAVSAYSSTDPNELSSAFSASLPKPVQKADLLGEYGLSCTRNGWLMVRIAAMRQLGFKTSTMSSNNTKVLAARRPQANPATLPYAQPVHIHS